MSEASSAKRAKRPSPDATDGCTGEALAISSMAVTVRSQRMPARLPCQRLYPVRPGTRSGGRPVFLYRQGETSAHAFVGEIGRSAAPPPLLGIGEERYSPASRRRA